MSNFNGLMIIAALVVVTAVVVALVNTLNVVG